MRIAHTIHGLGLGGAQKVVASIVRGRTQESTRYFVYSCNDGVHREEIEESGATVRILPRRFSKLDPLWVIQLARAMRRDRIDLVHCHLFGDSLHGYLAARRAGGVPVVMTLHIGPEGLRGRQPAGYRWLLRRATRVVSCSDAVRQSFVEASLASPGVIQSIPNGLEIPERQSTDPDRLATLRREVGASEETVLFATIGRLEPQKGHRDLLTAFKTACQSTDRDVRLLILGTGPLADELEAFAHELSVQDQVVFAGFRSDVPELLPAIDVIVFSSHFEGLPVALLEAMAAARCVVTTDVPGIIEAVRDDREALVAPRQEPDRLAAQMVRVAEGPELRLRLGTAAEQRFLETYTAASMVRSYEILYQEVIELS